MHCPAGVRHAEAGMGADGTQCAAGVREAEAGVSVAHAGRTAQRAASQRREPRGDVCKPAGATRTTAPGADDRPRTDDRPEAADRPRQVGRVSPRWPTSAGPVARTPAR